MQGCCERKKAHLNVFHQLEVTKKHVLLVILLFGWLNFALLFFQAEIEPKLFEVYSIKHIILIQLFLAICYIYLKYIKN